MCCKEVISYFDDSLAEPGTYSACNICPENEYPQRPAEQVNMLYHGLSSCAKYWEAALRGQIPYERCEPLQYFMR